MANHATPLSAGRVLAVAGILIALGACAGPTRQARPATDVRVMEECRDFAEQAVPTEPVHGNSRPPKVYPSRNPESLRTLFDLCVDAKEALR